MRRPLLIPVLAVGLCCLTTTQASTTCGDGKGSHDEDTSNGSCETNDKRWRWDPSSSTLPCNIHRISYSELFRSFGQLGLPNMYPYPLVLYPDDHDFGKPNKHLADITALDKLTLNFDPDFNVTLTGSDSLSSHRRNVPLTQYLHEVLTNNKEIGHEGETLPDQLGNETWYLFGETFTAEWTILLRNYKLPPCHSCSQLHYEQNLIALSFGIGNIGSGVQWHLHGPGFSETIHGRKHWVLYPPHQRPEYDLDYASRHWMENVYTTLQHWSELDVQAEKKRYDEYVQRWKSMNVESDRLAKTNISIKGKGEDRGPSDKKPWECTIHEGEMVYFPDGWHHATINLDKYTVFVSSFTSEHESTL
jgi:hypothetical protein